jgi:hypothetical protein
MEYISFVHIILSYQTYPNNGDLLCKIRLWDYLFAISSCKKS